MRKLYVLAFLVLSSFWVTAQTTVFSEDFNVSQGSAYTITAGPVGSSPIWNITVKFGDFGARIDNGILDLTNDGSAAVNSLGAIYTSVDFTNFSAPFNPILSLNSGLITWTFNMRQIRTDPSGFGFANYGVAFLLGANNATDGYAVLLGQNNTTDPIRLARVSGSVAGFTDLITSNTAGLADFGNEYLSIKVTYDPLTSTWELFVRNDGASFSDPAVGTLTSQGTVIDNTFTGTTLVNMGGFWFGSTMANQTAFFDNITVTVANASPNTITTGTVNSPPFVLANCSATAAGTVDFTTTDVFNGGNIFTAQLSDASGSFASPVAIGTLSLSGSDPAGSIPITIPAGTSSGTGYKIRVVSSNPVVTGSESAVFTITQNGVGCTSSATDYFRSRTSGNWSDPSTWETSADNMNWVTSTFVPTSAANTITIRSGHIVGMLFNANADQLVIEAGANLVHAAGTFTITDGTGDDISIQPDGIFILASGSNNPVLSGSATCNVLTGGILRVSGSGLTGTGSFIHNNNVIYQHASVLEYSSTSPFSTDNINYFPNADATTIPIFRLSSSIGSNVGANADTRWNGIFECNGSATFANGGDKIFRNGIRGTGTISAVTGMGAFVIDGVTAELGGTVVLDMAFSAGLKVGPSTDVTLTSSVEVDGNVQIFANSFITLGVFDLTVTGEFLNPLQSGFVRTNGSGRLYLDNVGSGFSGKFFHVGNTSANGVYINSIPQVTYGVRIVEPITPPIYNEDAAVKRTWYISTSANTPSTAITFVYTNPTDAGASYINAGPVELGIYIAVWNVIQSNLMPTPSSGLISGTDLYQVSTIASVNNFNGGFTEFPFVIGNHGSITLSNDCIVTARSQKVNNQGMISWEINSCNEVTGFEVQRSVNGSGFTTIGNVFPDSSLQYQFTDPAPGKGVNHYRIRVNRLTGGTKYSNTVAIINDSKGVLLNLAPNPVTDKTMITINSAGTLKGRLELYSQNGELLKTWEQRLTEGTNYVELSLGMLPRGTYYLRLQSEAGMAIAPLLRQ